MKLNLYNFKRHEHTINVDYDNFIDYVYNWHRLKAEILKLWDVYKVRMLDNKKLIMESREHIPFNSLEKAKEYAEFCLTAHIDLFINQNNNE